MLTFAKKIFLFLIPFIVLISFPTAVLLLGRELDSVKTIVKTQDLKPDTIYGFAYYNSLADYKRYLLADRDPSIVALGASHSLEIRKDFFIKSESFVNAGLGIASLTAMEAYIRDLPKDSKVNLVILNLDHEMFKYTPQSDWEYRDVRGNILSIWQKVYRDCISGKINLKKLFEKSQKTSNIGMNAIINEQGFRSDGSYQYGYGSSEAARQNDLKLKNDAFLASIKSDRSSFVFGDKILESQLNLIRNILQLCKDRGIYVVGFFPPYPNSIYTEIMSKDDVYKHTAVELSNEMRGLFAEYSLNFYDFFDNRIVGANDEEFIDFSHATDKTYLRMFIYMTEKDKNLNKFFDLDKLKKMLADAKGNYLVF